MSLNLYPRDFTLPLKAHWVSKGPLSGVLGCCQAPAPWALEKRGMPRLAESWGFSLQGWELQCQIGNSWGPALCYLSTRRLPAPMDQRLGEALCEPCSGVSGHQMLLESNWLNDFNVHTLESCGLNFSENTQGLKTQGQRILSPRRICFLFSFSVPVSVVIFAKTQACGKLFKMPEALVYSQLCVAWGLSWRCAGLKVKR